MVDRYVLSTTPPEQKFFGTTSAVWEQVTRVSWWTSLTVEQLPEVCIKPMKERAPQAGPLVRC